MNFLKKHWVKGVVLLVIFGGIGYFVWQGRASQEANTEEELQSQRASKTDISVTVTGSGQVYADGQANLKPQVAGDGLEITSVFVEDGQEVKKNDRIASLDNTDAVKEIRDAELAVWSAEIKMRQTEKMYDTETEDDRMARQTQEANLIATQNRLNDAKRDAGDYIVRAPFDGIVTDVSVEAGDSISRDEVLASVITKKRYAEVSLNEVDALKVSIGDASILTFDALDGLTVEGTVTRIDTIGTVEQGVVYYTAQITPNDGGESLRPGMSVNVSIETQTEKGVTAIPVSAVRSDAQGEYAYVLDNKNAQTYHRVSLETGVSDGVVTEVKQGVREGEYVVTKLPSTASVSSQEQSSGLLDSAVRTPGSGRR